jgi:hypothetical protein
VLTITKNFKTKKDGRTANKVFAKAGLDNLTSAMCKHWLWFGFDVQCSALVLNFNNIFLNEHLYRAGQSMNSLPSQIPVRCTQVLSDKLMSMLVQNK